MKWLNIFDLDDTLVDSSHRSKYFEDGTLDISHWKLNSTKDNIFNDVVYSDMFEIFKYLYHRDDCLVVAVTSRVLSEHDIEYLHSKGIFFNDYLHRDSGMLLDSKHLQFILKDYELKGVLLTNYFKLNQIQNENIGYGFDDKQHNLDVFEKFKFRVINPIDVNSGLLKYTDVINKIEKDLRKK